MGTASDIARAALAVVFTVAAVAKLLDLHGTRNTMLAFGVPQRLTSVAAVALPVLELAAAVALVVVPSARWGGLAALALLLAFIGGITNVLAHGRTLNCNCFGQIAAAPVSWRTLVRNAVLAALAVIVLARVGGSSLLGWTGGRSAAELIAGLLILVMVAGVVVGRHLWRQNRSLEAGLAQMKRDLALVPSGLPVGLRAPGFELADVRGETVTLGSLCARERPVVLFFMSHGCGPCDRLLPELGRWQAALGNQITFAVVSNGGPEREVIAQELRQAGDFVALIQEGQEVADYYRVHSTPSAIVVNPDGRIASASAGGPDEIEALVRLTVQRSRSFTGDLVYQAA